MEEPRLTPELLLHAYCIGIFPMSEGRDDPDVFWVDPIQRGIFPLNGFHISRSLARRLRQNTYTISYDKAFLQVVDGCANRDETWINAPIRDLYAQLHDMGDAHSLEVWQGPDLIGGVYGVTQGAGFFGESMFSTQVDASKIALAFLIDRLTTDGFELFDTQFLTPHLASLGAIEIPRDDYKNRLNDALRSNATFNRNAKVPSAQEIIQRNAQTS